MSLSQPGTGAAQGRCAQRSSTPLAELRFDEAEQAVLAVARHYFRSFAAPDTQSWIGGIGAALSLFDHARAPQVAVATLGAVQSMRRARRSRFHFNDPGCAHCAAGVTAHERGFLGTLACMRRGACDRASGHAVILCEGNDHVAFLRTMGTLGGLLPAVRRVA
jgi:hypothetical protein